MKERAGIKMRHSKGVKIRQCKGDSEKVNEDNMEIREATISHLEPDKQRDKVELATKLMQCTYSYTI